MLGILLMAALLGARHPIHSSSASLVLLPGARKAEIVVRVFADDFSPGRDRPSTQRYLTEHFRLLDRAGRAAPLQLDSLRVEGSVLIIHLTAPAPNGLSGAMIWHGVLAERFADQVNILQARYAGRSVSLLFSPSDGAKRLP